nr:MAG TPA: protein of unknown function DUF1868 [Caudoviricetes sp.]
MNTVKRFPGFTILQPLNLSSSLLAVLAKLL